jgi:hypothetical protein
MDVAYSSADNPVRLQLELAMSCQENTPGCGLMAVFDDRDKVVAMWRRNGVACFQVAEGNF